MALIGYARVSTLDQNIEPQLMELRAAGCDVIHEEKASGIKQARRVLRGLMTKMQKGDTLVVVRIDRLARSLPHLLWTIEDLRKKGCHFRSLRDPIDTSSPTGMFQLQIMGAVAELERNITRERTIAGIQAARARGRMPGNPGLIARLPEASRKASEGRKASYLDGLIATAATWMPIIQRLRPHTPWGIVLVKLNAARPAGTPPWTQERMVRAVRRMVKEGLADPRLLESAQAHGEVSRDAKSTQSLMDMVVGMKLHEPGITLRQIAERLERMKQRTPRGNLDWKPGSVAHLLKTAEKMGLLKTGS